MHIHRRELRLPPTIQAGVSVWEVPDAESLPGWVTTDCLNLLEQQRIERTRHPLAREQFRRGRLLLRNILAHHLSTQPELLTLELSADGKPFIPGSPWHFNLSHTHGMLVLAVAEAVIGIDIEAPAQNRDCDGLARRYFAGPEQQQYFSLPIELRPAAFLRGWTCKEALIKGTGAGVRDLQNCAVDVDPRLAPRVLLAPDAAEWQLQTWQAGEGYPVALALRG